MIKSIQSIRFYIILSIFITHLYFLANIPYISDIYTKYLGNGALGVTFFFILSGFVMRLGYGDKFQNISLNNYISFMKKRISKIYPIYIISTIIMFTFILYQNSFDFNIIISSLKKLILCIPLLQTLIPIQDINQSFNGATWFLSTLFILYVITPFLLKFNYNNKESLKKSVIYMLVMYIIYIVFLYLIIIYSPDKYRIGLMYCSPYMRVFQYILGILLGNVFLLIKDTIKYHKNVYNFFEIISLVLYIICFVFSPIISKKIINNDLSIIVSYSSYIFLSMFIIFIFSLEKGIISKFLSMSKNLHMGSISFYIYIVHLPIIDIFYYFISKHDLFIKPFYYFLPFICFFVTLFISLLYEKKVMKK